MLAKRVGVGDNIHIHALLADIYTLLREQAKKNIRVPLALIFFQLVSFQSFQLRYFEIRSFSFINCLDNNPIKKTIK